eukprot:6192221-Pleurochrysis_carterae.AAC.5
MGYTVDRKIKTHPITVNAPVALSRLWSRMSSSIARLFNGTDRTFRTWAPATIGACAVKPEDPAVASADAPTVSLKEGDVTFTVERNSTVGRNIVHNRRSIISGKC